MTPLGKERVLYWNHLYRTGEGKINRKIKFSINMKSGKLMETVVFTIQISLKITFPSKITFLEQTNFSL